ncbi:unnamed protein product [marine sediment metagenome]|uniref:Uncharacterized protein n=1 Tax=marine sediment metagenome TaxID=412755 RepID=X1NBR5_9ZZZZ
MEYIDKISVSKAYSEKERGGGRSEDTELLKLTLIMEGVVIQEFVLTQRTLKKFIEIFSK